MFGDWGARRRQIRPCSVRKSARRRLCGPRYLEIFRRSGGARAHGPCDFFTGSCPTVSAALSDLPQFLLRRCRRGTFCLLHLFVGAELSRYSHSLFDGAPLPHRPQGFPRRTFKFTRHDGFWDILFTRFHVFVLTRL